MRWASKGLGQRCSGVGAQRSPSAFGLISIARRRFVGPRWPVLPGVELSRLPSGEAVGGSGVPFIGTGGDRIAVKGDRDVRVTGDQRN